MKVKKLGPNMTELDYSDGLRVLISYEVPVAAVLPDGRRIQSEQFYSRTTLRHIGQFFKDDGTARITRATVPEAAIRAIVEER